jgi:hypothetical protein
VLTLLTITPIHAANLTIETPPTFQSLLAASPRRLQHPESKNREQNTVQWPKLMARHGKETLIMSFISKGPRQDILLHTCIPILSRTSVTSSHPPLALTQNRSLALLSNSSLQNINTSTSPKPVFFNHTRRPSSSRWTYLSSFHRLRSLLVRLALTAHP